MIPHIPAYSGPLDVHCVIGQVGLLLPPDRSLSGPADSSQGNGANLGNHTISPQRILVKLRALPCQPPQWPLGL